MYPTKEQLTLKWWHRLSKVLRWVVSIGTFVIAFKSTRILGYQSYRDVFLLGETCAIKRALSERLLISLIVAVIVFFVYWLIYKKVILFIVFGKRHKTK